MDLALTHPLKVGVADVLVHGAAKVFYRHPSTVADFRQLTGVTGSQSWKNMQKVEKLLIKRKSNFPHI
jgi:hypothetical protein